MKNFCIVKTTHYYATPPDTATNGVLRALVLAFWATKTIFVRRTGTHTKQSIQTIKISTNNISKLFYFDTFFGFQQNIVTVNDWLTYPP